MLIMMEASGQSAFKQNFDRLTTAGEWDAIPSLLERWESSSPDEAELFIAQFNYYFHACRQEIVTMVDTQPWTEHLVVTDTLTGDTTAYMFSQLVYNDSIFELAMSAINRGLKLYPRRLDMHFGKIYILRERGVIQAHVEAIKRVINEHAKYHDRWLWANAKPLEDVDETFTGAIQDYCYALFNLPQAELDGVEQISTLMSQLYPSDVRFYSNLGACRLMRQDFSTALPFFLKAHELVDDDPVVLSNIAYTYRMLGDTETSIAWYQRLAAVGSDEEAVFARQQIAALKAAQ
jgi:hypothetical protein